VIISYEGTDYEFDQEKITVDQWRELKRKYQMTPRRFEGALDEADPDAYTFLYWVMLHQNGGTPKPLGDNLKFDLIALNHAVGSAAESQAAREEEEGEPDPTPGGSLPGTRTPSSPGSSTVTSEPSATST